MATIIFNKSELTTGKGYLLGKIEYSYSQSINNKSSTITCAVYIKKDSDSVELTTGTEAKFKYTLTVDGDTANPLTGEAALTITDEEYKLIGSFSKTVIHKDDGTRTMTISGYITMTSNSSSVYYGKKTTVNATITFQTIPLASTLTSASNITLGNNFSFKWTPASTSFKYRIKLSLGSWTITLPSSSTFIASSTTNPYTYSSQNVYDNICAQLPSSTSGTVTATLTTYNSGGTQIGSSSSKTFTVTIPSSEKPTVGTVTLTPQTYDCLIQGKNKLRISVSGSSPGKGSSIKSYTFSGTGISTTTTNSSVTSSGNISPSGTSNQTLTYRITVTDQRGRTNYVDKTITCYAYSPPILSNFTVYRVDANGNATATDEGTYLKYSFNTTCSSVNNTNTITSMSIGYKAASSTGGYTSKAITSTNGTVQDVTFSTTTTYSIQITIKDTYGGTDTRIATLSNASRILNILNNGTGVAFGKMAEDNSKLDSAWTVHARNGVTNDSDRNLKTNIENMSDIQEQFFSKLQPVTFQFINGTSGRTHYGFISQDVEDSLYDIGMTPKDFAGFCKDRRKTYLGEPMIDENGNAVYNYSLRYSEFIALNTFMIQKLQAENAELRSELQELKEMIVGTSSKNVE